MNNVIVDFDNTLGIKDCVVDVQMKKILSVILCLGLISGCTYKKTTSKFTMPNLKMTFPRITIPESMKKSFNFDASKLDNLKVGINKDLNGISYLAPIGYEDRTNEERKSVMREYFNDKYNKYFFIMVTDKDITNSIANMKSKIEGKIVKNEINGFKSFGGKTLNNKGLFTHF